jgi:tetratricopeptide (TPR) repeat protein
MTTELLSDKAKKAYNAKKFKEASDLFGQAADTFTSNGNSLMAAEMKNNQSVALLQNGNAQAAYDMVIGTDEVFAAEGDKKRQGMALANQASALEALTRKKEAIDLYERSASLLAEAGENNLRADVMRSISAIQVGQGKFVDAVMSMQDGVIEVKELTLKQRIIKKLLFMRLWR